ncbi:MAG: MBL fold metallo-hydrolase [Subdoligranulum sp.]|nr:MBL fold metallo-hydrolase [Subdoligranulum sp.]MDD7265365.1 MBL fold metallo-hydrolase [Subdoligranulum sp.]MDY5922795.1 MBL fold metallo-hydrolase [Oscillospiraceae bacterium]
MKAFHIVGPAPLCTNTFLLVTDAGHAVAIDPAADASLYEQALEQTGAKLTHILCTHGHYDHVGAVKQLREKWGCKVYLDPADAKGNSSLPMTESDSGYVDGGEIKVDELTFKTWHTPGHTPGSWVILCGDMFFTGDTLFHGSIGRTDLPGGSMMQMEESLQKLLELPVPDKARVLPGHEAFSTMADEKRHNYYLREFMEE